MLADPSEGRERARQEFETWAKKWFLGKRNYLGGRIDGAWCYDALEIQCAWVGWLAGRRSLEQERDELRETLTQILWLFPSDETIRDLEADDKNYARPCPMTKAPTDKDVLRWRAAVHKGDS